MTRRISGPRASAMVESIDGAMELDYTVDGARIGLITCK